MHAAWLRLLVPRHCTQLALERHAVHAVDALANFADLLLLLTARDLLRDSFGGSGQLIQIDRVLE